MVTSTDLTIVSGEKELDNIEQETFCTLFASDAEMFGNGTQAYIEAYDVDTSKPNAYKHAQTSASRLLMNGIILARINYLLENKLGFSELHADKQLAFLITQSADLRVKLGAIREFNALKGRVKKKLELSFNDSSDEELDQELEAVEEELRQAQALLTQRKGKQSTDAKGMPQLTDEQKEAMARQEVDVEPAS